MHRPLMVLTSAAALAVALFAFSSPAEARRANWHHYSKYTLYYDYSYGNSLSPWSYIYPAANWGPFFHRVRHYGPVLSYRPTPAW